MNTESKSVGRGRAAITVDELTRAYISSVPDLRPCVLAKIAFWAEQLRGVPIAEVTPDDIDEALSKLIQRGKLRPVRNSAPVSTGEPLSPATVNRYLSTLAGIHKWARRNRILPKSSVSPTRGVEREREARPDPQKYLRPEQIEKLIAVARVTDARWRKLPAFIRLSFATGLRKSNVLNLRWSDLDLAVASVTVERTKNGDPVSLPLSSETVAELRKLPRGGPDELVFGNAHGKPFHIGRVWERAVTVAGMPHVTIHYLRHSTGSALAASGANQATLMRFLGHKSLGASARYLHLDVRDLRNAAEGVFA